MSRYGKYKVVIGTEKLSEGSQANKSEGRLPKTVTAGVMVGAVESAGDGYILPFHTTCT